MSTLLVVAGLCLASLSAGAVVLLVLGFAACVERRWKEAGIKLAAGVAASLVGFVSLGWAARSLIRDDVWTEGVSTEMKARALADGISALMNVSVLGLPFGLLAGVILLWRRRRARTREP